MSSSVILQCNVDKITGKILSIQQDDHTKTILPGEHVLHSYNGMIEFSKLHELIKEDESTYQR